MKKFILLFAVVIAAFIKINARQPAKPDAKLQKIWVDYDTYSGNQYGMMIHVDFTTYEMKGIPVEFAVFFDYYDGENLVWLKDNNGRYNSPGGYVGVAKKITPSYETSVFTDIQVFMPYDELDLDAGTHDLSMELYINYLPPKKGSVAFLGYKDFTYTQYDEGRGLSSRGETVAKAKSAKNSLVAEAAPSATFEKLWVDHNITDENGNKGMIIHYKFVTHNMKDVEAYVASYFDYNDGSGLPLKDKNKKYYTSGGNVAVFKSIYPGYDTAYYDDLRVFMPYEEFDLPAGDYNLSFEAILIFKNGGIISKFGWYDFTYNKPADR